jgi:hypothetical protein
MEPVAFSIAELAKRGTVGRKSKIYDEINAGRLEALKRGRSTIITAEAERRYLEALPRIQPHRPDRQPDPKAIERGRLRHQRKAMNASKPERHGQPSGRRSPASRNNATLSTRMRAPRTPKTAP